MQSYLINIEISFINQLSRLYPDLASGLLREIDNISTQFGGTILSPYKYTFSKLLNDTPHHVADAAWAIHTRLKKDSRLLYGTTVCILPNREEEEINADQPLFPCESGENRLWIYRELKSRFTAHFEMIERGKFLLVNAPKEIEFRLEEQLPALLIRQDRLIVLTQAIERLENSKNSKGILIHGELGSGKRATLYEAIRLLHANNVLIESVPCATWHEDPTVPFIRNLRGTSMFIGEYLNGKDADWWFSEGKRLLEIIRNGSIWDRSSDQDFVDIIRTFTLYYKGLTTYHRQKGTFVYLIIDGFDPGIETVVPFMSVLSNLMGIEGLRVIVIHDSNDFSKAIPFPGNGIEVRFQNPSFAEWSRIVLKLTGKKTFSKETLKQLARICGANLYRLFYSLLIGKSGDTSGLPVEKALLGLLDNAARETLFLATAAAGLANKALLIERFPSSNEQILESNRYETLKVMGMLREETDGLISAFSRVFYNHFQAISQYASAAAEFGTYLVNRRKEGVNIDLYQLAQYLRTWGSKESISKVIDETIDVLLTKRHFHLAEKFLENAEIPENNEKERTAFYTMMDGGKLRLYLLRKAPKDLQRIDKIFNDHVSEYFLNKASLVYAQGQWEAAFVLAKKSLSAFQRIGDHKGETYAHLELGLAQLALRRIRDAQDHFDIARRIGTQINAVWGEIRAVVLRTVTIFLHGNLSQAMKECLEHREFTRREGRRDVWMLLTLVAVRIEWELGQYREVEKYAEEGMQIAELYKFKDEKRVFGIWRGRSLLAQNKEEGRTILESFTASSDESAFREALTFLAEHAWFNKQYKEAKRLILLAASEPRLDKRILSETEDWTDGYRPVEGRLGSEASFMDVLAERISAMNVLFNSKESLPQEKQNLSVLIEQLKKSSYSPYSHEITLCVALSLQKKENTQQHYYIRQAFMDLQSRAARIDSNQIRHAWLNNNPWNKLLMDESRKMKFR